ncbi:MAG: hypothetical protein ACOYMR_04660 [Ilumatobacteraceae bacterium]
MTVTSPPLLWDEVLSDRAPVCTCGAPALAEVSAPWLPWRSRGWPVTRREERTFLLDLWELTGGRPGTYRRSDATAILNALRGGLTVGELLDAAPGLVPAKLLAAYLDLQHRRRTARAAWDEIVALRTADAVLELAVAANRIAPGPVSQLWSIARTRPELVPDAVARIEQRCAAAFHVAAEVEQRIERCAEDCGHRPRLALQLFEPGCPTLWSDPAYLPARVTDIVPDRLRTLLDEDAA